MIRLCKEYIGDENRALIPNDKSYYRQMKKYENELARVGISKAHGLRHAYAQRLYKDLTGWDCSAKGGRLKSALNEGQRIVDAMARETISEVLGHERLEVVAIYLGK